MVHNPDPPRFHRAPAAGTLAGVALMATLVLGAPFEAAAQYDRPPPPAAYAVPNATLVTADGEPEEPVTLVVRGGTVTHSGPEVEVPADARVLEGDELWIYPGLVDAWGLADAELPRIPARDEVTPWDRDRRAQGFTPHRRMVDHLTADGASLAERRAEGVLASGVFPTSGFASGLGAVLVHRPLAEGPRELVADPEAGLALSFQGSPTTYPSTVMGVVAALRQRFSDAQRLVQLQSAYRDSPNGLTIPPWDPDLDVLRRAAGAGLPVFFAASSAEDIRRVLTLAYELGFTPVIVGGDEAWTLGEELAGLDVPVLVSLDFPERRWWRVDGELRPDVSGNEDQDPDAARERERLENLYANAARLESAGVEFALTSGGGVADLLDGARRLIAYGLSEEGALRALTSAPAGLLGIEPLSRVVVGYGATFIVTDGPLFDEGTRVLYTFVEGVLDEAERESGQQPEQDSEGDPDTRGGAG